MLERQGTEPFKKLYSDIGTFPTLDPKWNESNFILEEALAGLVKLGEWSSTDKYITSNYDTV